MLFIICYLLLMLFLLLPLFLSAARPVINPFLFGELREGMRTTVVCSVLSGDQSEPLDITWFKDSQPLKTVHPEAELLRMGLYYILLPDIIIKASAHSKNMHL